jgi:chromosome segregation ATPase
MQASNRTTLTDESIAELVADLQQRVDELENELEHEREQRRELEDTVDELKEERDQLQEENEELREQLRNTTRALAKVDRQMEQVVLDDHGRRLFELEQQTDELVDELNSISSTTKDIVKVVNNETTEIENRIDALERGTAEPVSPGTDELSIETPLENITAWSQPTADRKLSANQLRARTIASAPRQFCEKIGDADNRRYRISTRSIRKVIRTAHEESIPRETANRIVEFLDKLGKQWTERRTIRGMTYVVFEAEFIDRLEEAAERNLAASLVDTSVTQGVTG